MKPDIEEKLHNFNKAVLLIGNYAEKMIEVLTAYENPTKSKEIG